MEPNKIEKQFRAKLNARVIQPSAQAWDRLDAMLSVAEEKKTKRPFGFLFIAASILVLVTLGLFFFTQNGTAIKPINNVVGTETKNDTVQNPSKTIQNPIIGSQKQNEVVVDNQPATNNRQPITKKSIINQKTTVNQKENDNQNQIIKDKAIEYQNSSDVALKDLPRIETRKEIVIESKKEIKSDDALLADLDKTAKQFIGKKTTMKVDAKNLLSQVDGELELTFREKMINKVNKNYQEVKVALANRNKE
ncbi:hypothetical protein [Flavobacterium phycosphaerae]|uniref:hypothetical protein n=1 Tax=Flavobacterium phycosphaerae TaxID=2697515 RepID=UPI0013899789|nr:hypothetical protein [Flavobacterium phycosphaerae]